MTNKLVKLLDVKSIVTLILTIVFAVLSLTGKITAEQFLTAYTVIISFYFGVQFQKNAEKKDKEETK